MRGEIGDLPLNVRNILLDRALQGLTPVAFRAYMYLMFEQWQSGPLPMTLGELAALARCTPTIFKRKVWPDISEYFEKTSVKGEEKLIEPESYSRRIDAINALVRRQEQAEKQRQIWAQKKTPALPERQGRTEEGNQHDADLD